MIFQGTPAQLLEQQEGVTAAYLTGARSIPTPAARRPALKGDLVIRGARANNLKGIDVKIPLGVLTAVTGVSGSGKSTLVNDILYKSLARTLYRAGDEPGVHDRIDGVELIDKVIDIDQSPIGRTPRSNPATYTGLFTFIRDLFAMMPDQRRGDSARAGFLQYQGRAMRGMSGRRRDCHRDALPADVYVTCEQCKGRRYSRETLEIAIGASRSPTFSTLTVDHAAAARRTIPPSPASCARSGRGPWLYRAGTVGHDAFRRRGLARREAGRELSKRGTGRTLCILDEPTTGLHLRIRSKLLDVLTKLVDQGSTIVVIEHNLDVIKSADHLIDLGPEGCVGGGRIVAEGTPEEVARIDRSPTGQFLAKLWIDEQARAIRQAAS